MDKDEIILADSVSLESSDAGKTRPNNNAIIEGASGSGKSYSVLDPNIIKTNIASIIVSYNKWAEAWKMAKYKCSKGYTVYVCDLVHPELSTGIIDPLRYLTTFLDVETIAKSIVMADPDSKNAKDIYWNNGAIALLKALILLALMIIDNATTKDVLDLFDSLLIEEDGKGIKTSLDEIFEEVEMRWGKCPAVTAYADYQQLPYTTAGCIRDSLAKAIQRIFPEPIRQMMGKDNLIDFEELATRKTMFMIITSPVNTSLYLFANLVFEISIKQLLEFAERCDGQRLPRPVRLMFDDFACGARINDFSRHISIFRSAGISAMILLQSESQLRQMYSEAESENIINNCSVYVYLSGGMDLVTCRHISQRLDVPLTDILYAPIGQVLVMQSGRKPIWAKRYDIFNSKEYKEYLEIIEKSERKSDNEQTRKIRRRTTKNLLQRYHGRHKVNDQHKENG